MLAAKVMVTMVMAMLVRWAHDDDHDDDGCDGDGRGEVVMMRR